MESDGVSTVYRERNQSSQREVGALNRKKLHEPIDEASLQWQSMFYSSQGR